MTSSDARAAIRVAVLGLWVPSLLADVLALQRAEEPETAIALVQCTAAAPSGEATEGSFDFAVTTTGVHADRVPDYTGRWQGRRTNVARSHRAIARSRSGRRTSWPRPRPTPCAA